MTTGIFQDVLRERSFDVRAPVLRMPGVQRDCTAHAATETRLHKPSTGSTRGIVSTPRRARYYEHKDREDRGRRFGRRWSVIWAQRAVRRNEHLGRGLRAGILFARYDRQKRKLPLQRAWLRSYSGSQRDSSSSSLILRPRLSSLSSLSSLASRPQHQLHVVVADLEDDDERRRSGPADGSRPDV